VSAKPYSLYKDFIKGLWEESPTFRQLIGMCPTLAVTNSAINGMAMGLATCFVLVSSSTIISIFRKLIPKQVRIATFVVIIATFVTMADLFLAGQFPSISKALGPYVPLIVVNCIILARQEAFASKNPVHRSMVDALGMGLGFTWALTGLGIIREILGKGSLFGVRILGNWFVPWVIMLMPPGAFITLGVVIGLMNTLTGRKAEKGGCH
jgi:electron transport complex protein RnfE